MFNPKRKRENENDSDDEEPSFGRQILPVANLPDSFDGVPSDGMEYLFTVRRNARRLPHVTRVANPYQISETVPLPSTSLGATHPSLPSTEWRSLLEIRFRNLRKNLMQPINPATPMSSNRRMPDLKDRSAWWEFLAGKPESVWNPPNKSKALKQKNFGRGMRAFDDDSAALSYSVESGEDQVPPPSSEALDESPPQYKPVTPTTLLVYQVDDRMALHLLMYFTYWINQNLSGSQPPFSRLTPAHFQWIFALLTRIEDHISADDMNLLRNLARACIALLKALICERGSEAEQVMEESEAVETSCWMIISVVIGVWAQRDLWMDAEDMLNGIKAA